MPKDANWAIEHVSASALDLVHDATPPLTRAESYGPLAELAEIPPGREEAVRAHLAEVGLTGPRESEPDDSLPYLYCRAQQDSRIESPQTFAVYGQLDVLSNLELMCPHVYPPPSE